jgi:hypothetical protein
MLRMVIEGNTKSDMTKWLKDYYSDIERVSGAFSLTTSISILLLFFPYHTFSYLLSLILYLSHSCSSLVLHLSLSDCVCASYPQLCMEP